MNNDEIIARVSAYYTQKLETFGETPRGVDWNSEFAQHVRFEQVLSVIRTTEPFTINDFGCGYGALFDSVREMPGFAGYTGYDVSAAMIAAARARYPAISFVDRLEDLAPADYTVASGIFSVKGDATVADWQSYVFATIDSIRERSTRGFAFNCLTAYSEPARMRDDLFYADPHEIFDLCRTRYTQNVALLHDYGIYEFTVRVRLN